MYWRELSEEGRREHRRGLLEHAPRDLGHRARGGPRTGLREPSDYPDRDATTGTPRGSGKEPSESHEAASIRDTPTPGAGGQSPPPVAPLVRSGCMDGRTGLVRDAPHPHRFGDPCPHFSAMGPPRTNDPGDCCAFPALAPHDPAI